MRLYISMCYLLRSSFGCTPAPPPPAAQKQRARADQKNTKKDYIDLRRQDGHLDKDAWSLSCFDASLYC